MSAIIAAGIVPAAMEMMDQLCLAGRRGRTSTPGSRSTPRRCCSWRSTGCPHGVAADVERIAEYRRAHGARTVRIAQDDAERALLWKGRKIGVRRDRAHQAQLLPARHRRAARANFPRCCDQVYEIAARHELLVMNVFHAGDGNLHPLLVFDTREPGVHRAGPRRRRGDRARVRGRRAACCSGEHGIGLEKRDYMSLMFSDADLAAQDDRLIPARNAAQDSTAPKRCARERRGLQ